MQIAESDRYWVPYKLTYSNHSKENCEIISIQNFRCMNRPSSSLSIFFISLFI